MKYALALVVHSKWMNRVLIIYLYEQLAGGYIIFSLTEIEIQIFK